jgi:rhamnosyltransferase
MPAPVASVIVRAKNEASSIEATFEALRRQTVASEIVVVDSGSTDGTLDIARRWCDRLVEIPAEEFTFGHALNVGAAAATHRIHFALSAHCAPHRDDWIERALAHYEDAQVAATNGHIYTPDGEVMLEPFRQTSANALADPYWGFSNHAASWRADVWERFAFDERIEACEDKEWAWRVLGAGYVIVFDPFLRVRTGHRRAAGLRALFRRTVKESRALASRADIPPFTFRRAVHEWWREAPAQSTTPQAFHRLNYLRATEILGRAVGEHQGRRIRREGGF